MKYNVCSNEGERTSVTVFFGGGQLPQVATKDHPNFEQIIEEVEAGNDNDAYIRDLFDVGVAIGRQFDQLSERVSVNHGKVFFDGVEIDNALTQQIVRFYTEGNDDFVPLVAFFEKIAQNPNEHSRDHLFQWLSHNQFGFHPDGDIVAYKGVCSRGREWDDELNDFVGDEVLVSSHTGSALVNGELIEGQIPNNPDTVVTMPRDAVAFDPSRGCSSGLHVSNFGYSSTWGDTVVQVKINPRDVVSVPTESSWQKMRVCRYRVLQIVNTEDPYALYVGDPEKTAHVVTRPAAVKGSRVSAGRKASSYVLGGRKLPTYYEEFSLADFKSVPRKTLRWLAGEWGVSQGRDKETMCGNLAKEAKKRKRTWR